MVEILISGMNSSSSEEDPRRSQSLSYTSRHISQSMRDLSSSTLSNVNNFNLQYQQQEKQEKNIYQRSQQKYDDDLPRIEEHVEINTDKFDENFGEARLSKMNKTSTSLLKMLNETYHLTPEEYYHKNFDNKNKNMTETFYNTESFYNSSSYSASFMNSIQSKTASPTYSSSISANSPVKLGQTLSPSSLTPVKVSPLKNSFSSISLNSTYIDEFDSDYFDKAPDQPIYYRTIKPFEENKRKLKKSLNTLKSLTKYNNISHIYKKKEKIEEKKLEENDNNKNNEIKESLISPKKTNQVSSLPSPTYYLSDPISSSLSPLSVTKKTSLPSSLSPLPSEKNTEDIEDHSIEYKVQKVKDSYEELGMTFNQEHYTRYQNFLNSAKSNSSTISPSSSCYSIPTINNPIEDKFYASPFKLIPTDKNGVNINIKEKSSSRPSTPGYILLNNSASLNSPQVTPLSSRPLSSSRPSSSGFQTFNLPQSSIKVSIDGVPVLTSNYSTNIEKLNELNVAKNYGEDSFRNVFSNSEVPLVAQSQQTIPFSHLENIIKKATRNGLKGKIVDDVGGWGGIGTLIDEEIEERRKKKQWNMKLREKRNTNEKNYFNQTNDSNFVLNSNFNYDEENNSFENDQTLENDNESLPTIYQSENGDSEVWSNPSYSHSTCLSPISPRFGLSPKENKLFSSCISPLNSSRKTPFKLKIHNDISNSNLFNEDNLLDPIKGLNQEEELKADEQVDNSKEINEKEEEHNNVSRNLNNEFDLLNDNEFKFEDEDEDEVQENNNENISFFQYEKDFNLFPTPNNIKSNTARPYKSSNIFEETYQFDPNYLKEVLQSPKVPSTSSSLFKSDVIHPVLIETSREGLVLHLHSEIPKNRPLSARDKIESEEFKLKDEYENDFNKTNDTKSKSLSSPIKNHTLSSSAGFFSTTTPKLSELNPLTSTSYSTLSSNLLINCDENLRKFQYLKNITKEEEEVQYNILMQLFHQTNGKNWKKKSNWGNKDVSLNSWYGLSISPQGYIVSIELKNNNLIGPFPDLLANFYYLETIFLDSNQLEGELPDYLINQCPNLISLSVTHNNLNGIIAFNLINKQNKLKELWLGHNKFYGIIQDGIGDLKSLTHLDLSSNNLESKIPLTFGKLHKLIYLNLSNNKLIGVIPSSVASLSNLKYLYLNNNNLSGKVPFWILKKKKTNKNEGESHLSNLNKVEIFDNPLLEIDDDYKI